MYSPAAGDAGECGFSTLLPREALMPGNGQWQLFFIIILAASGMGFSSGRMQSSLAVSFACDGESFFFYSSSLFSMCVLAE